MRLHAVNAHRIRRIYRYRERYIDIAAGKRDLRLANRRSRYCKFAVCDRRSDLLRIGALRLCFVPVGRNVFCNVDRIYRAIRHLEGCSVFDLDGRFALCNGCDDKSGINRDLISGLFAFTADQPCHEFKVLIFRNARLRQREFSPTADLRLHAINAHRVCTIYRYLKCYGNICTRERNRRFAFDPRRYGERILRHRRRCYGIVR